MSSSQMLKGILDGCLLAIIHRRETYGYEMIEKLELYGFRMVSEGSIYPVLLRLQKEGFVKSVMKESPSGPKRKYYTLTSEGEQEYLEFKERWDNLSQSVNRLVKEEK
ncbi:PadR family transcriptional regulator [Planococcus beigongshangi]|uniref:PadR family transcriptional regulator n=1 Tax=Planococcus beigongshangi TaxID=2782536 RepID=UPI00193B0CD6|nr:PadR family transcriptional regulator [Planococcus beigongshangi]